MAVHLPLPKQLAECGAGLCLLLPPGLCGLGLHIPKPLLKELLSQIFVSLLDMVTGETATVSLLAEGTLPDEPPLTTHRGSVAQ